MTICSFEPIDRGTLTPLYFVDERVYPSDVPLHNALPPPTSSVSVIARICLWRLGYAVFSRPIRRLFNRRHIELPAAADNVRNRGLLIAFQRKLYREIIKMISDFILEPGHLVPLKNYIRLFYNIIDFYNLLFFFFCNTRTIFNCKY